MSDRPSQVGGYRPRRKVAMEAVASNTFIQAYRAMPRLGTARIRGASPARSAWIKGRFDDCLLLNSPHDR